MPIDTRRTSDSEDGLQPEEDLLQAFNPSRKVMLTAASGTTLATAMRRTVALECPVLLAIYLKLLVFDSVRHLALRTCNTH
jgi:hypothetical protein